MSDCGCNIQPPPIPGERGVVMDSREPYSQYLKAFALARIGGTLGGGDFQDSNYTPQSEAWHVATALGVAEGRNANATEPKTKSEFASALQQLSS